MSTLNRVALIFFVILAIVVLLAFARYQFLAPSYDAGKDPSIDDWKNASTFTVAGLAAIGAIVSAWASFVNADSQAHTATELERVKKVLERSVPAYGSMFAAAHRYYRALAPLETGNFLTDQPESAEAAMKDAEGEIIWVADEFANLWLELWQTARFLKEKAAKISHDRDAQKKLWQDRARKISDLLAELKSSARKLVQFI